MSCRENISYLVPRDPSIKCWSDRVKLPGPCSKNLIQLKDTDEFEETMGDKIKVYLRLKPSLSPDNPYTVLGPNTLQTEAPKESVSYKNVTNGVGKLIHKFTFTAILDQETTQAKVFKKCAVKNLKKFLSGENYLLMAYGTTSAGKTYTMQGNVENPGVIPRALDFVFSSLKDSIIPTCRYSPYQYNEFIVLSDEQLKKDLMLKSFILSLDLTRYQRYPDATHITLQTNSSSGYSDSYENITFKEMQSNLVETESFEVGTSPYKYSVWISMVEIYNEQVYDLLELPNEKGARAKLTFRDDEDGNTFVKNLRYVHVSSGHEAFQILQFGRSNLHLAPTALNHSSSRSHCIFTITLAKFLDYEASSHAIISRFSFCDLAGMERAKKTLNLKDRLVESKAINTSLSILVKCLTTFKENQNSKEKKMIPYRESKLTKLFRDAVLGKEQFSLIVNVTTETNLFDETLNVLKFSAIAQKIVPQNVFPKPKMTKAIKRSRFSRIVVSSGYNSKTIIDWDASTGAETKLKDSGCETEAEDSQDLIASLREQLAKERERCETIESEIREELTNKFSEILKKQNENNQIRLENETERLQEMYEKKEKRLVYYYEMLRKNKKRPKLDEDVSDDEDEKRLKELETNAELMRAENGTLREQLQELLAENNRLMSECSELKFKLVEKDRQLEATKRAYEANEEGADAHEKELRRQLDEANAKITNFKSLLDEAASDYKELEESNKYLRNENEILEQQLTEHREAVADLKNENAELQKMLSQKRILIEKLEAANDITSHELKAGREVEKKTSDELSSSRDIQSISIREVEILREQLKKTSEWLGQSRQECDDLREEKLELEKDLEIANLKIADLQSKVLTCEENSEREAEMERRLEEFRAEAETLKTANQVAEQRCKDLEAEVRTLQKEVKELIAKANSETSHELDQLTKDNENYQKELLSLKTRNGELEEELKRQTEKLDSAQRESRIALESLRAKFEAVEYQNTVMKNLKDEAERQAYDIPQLHQEIKRLEKEIENREKDMASFNENRKAIFNNYEKEITRLKEENERLRKDILFATEVVAKTKTPLKADKEELGRLKESVKKKDEEITKLKAEVESMKVHESASFKKPELGESHHKLNGSTSNRDCSPAANSPDRLEKQMQNLSLQPPQQRSTRKKVDLPDELIHPLSLKRTVMGRKKKENGKKDEEITKLKAEVESMKVHESASFKKPELGESHHKLNGSTSNRDCSPAANSPDRLEKQMQNLSLQPPQQRSTRKKVDLLDESIHPSSLKRTVMGRKKKENGKKEEEKEEVMKVEVESEKENLGSKKRGKCSKNLFKANDYDNLNHLKDSPIPLEENSRLRPRK